MGRLCGGAHEISGINFSPWVGRGGVVGWVGVGVVVGRGGVGRVSVGGVGRSGWWWGGGGGMQSGGGVVGGVIRLSF